MKFVYLHCNGKQVAVAIIHVVFVERVQQKTRVHLVSGNDLMVDELEKAVIDLVFFPSGR